MRSARVSAKMAAVAVAAAVDAMVVAVVMAVEADVVNSSSLQRAYTLESGGQLASAFLL